MSAYYCRLPLDQVCLDIPCFVTTKLLATRGNDMIKDRHKERVEELYCYWLKSVHIRSYSSPHFAAFGLNTETYSVTLHIQSECRKIQTRITQNTDIFCVVCESKDELILRNFLHENPEPKHSHPRYLYQEAKNKKKIKISTGMEISKNIWECKNKDIKEMFWVNEQSDQHHQLLKLINIRDLNE